MPLVSKVILRFIKLLEMVWHAWCPFCELGADIHRRNNDGYTALHLAARQNHGDIVHDLLNFGADQNIKNLFGKTPAAVAKANQASAALAAFKTYESSQSFFYKVKKIFSRQG